MREKKLNSLRDEAYGASDQEWRDVVNYILTQRGADRLTPEISKTLQAGCDISTGRLNLIIRTKVEDIVHKLGTLVLKEGDAGDENVVFWALEAVSSRDRLAKQHERDVREAADRIELIDILQQRLEALTSTKNDHEHELLSKFTLLLNEKKLKIRTRERQLANDSEAKQAGRTPKKTTTQPKSRTPKNKRAMPEDDDDSDAFESMDIGTSVMDKAAQKPANDDTDDSQNTTSSSEDEPVHRDVPLHSKTSQAKTIRAKSTTPPLRQLPFKRNDRQQTEKSTDPISTIPGSASDQDETASEDDEL